MTYSLISHTKSPLKIFQQLLQRLKVLCFVIFKLKIYFSQIQGAILVASLLEMFIGFSGLVGYLLRFIGPLTVAPTITLVGMALFPVAMEQSGELMKNSLFNSAEKRLYPQFKLLTYSFLVDFKGYHWGISMM